VLPAVLVAALAHPQRHVTRAGVVYAVASGMIASGIGYVIWYAALRGLTATRAAMVQLAVPVIAALGAVAFLAETIGLRLVVSAFLILGGLGLALMHRTRIPRARNTD
jgi:drug/metabolite transporter (DMT)-like permease